MDCEGLRSRLDAYIDGELAEDEARALVEHARGCEACRRELECAELVRDALGEMDRDVKVPLEAQAAWRGAIRAEAQRTRRRRWMRAAYAAAAALVIVIGAGTAMQHTPEAARPLPALTPESVDAGVIARDGDLGTAEPHVEQEEAYAAWKKIAVADVQAAADTLRDLAAEYSGSCEEEGGAVRIELPGAYLEDFLTAASRIGTELDSETGAGSSETAIVYIQIQEQ